MSPAEQQQPSRRVWQRSRLKCSAADVGRLGPAFGRPTSQPVSALPADPQGAYIARTLYETALSCEQELVTRCDGFCVNVGLPESLAPSSGDGASLREGARGPRSRCLTRLTAYYMHACTTSHKKKTFIKLCL